MGFFPPFSALIFFSLAERTTESNQEQSSKAMMSTQEELQRSLSDAAQEKKEMRTSQARLQDDYNYMSSEKARMETNNRILSQERDTLRTSQSQQQAGTTTLTKERDKLKASESTLKGSNAELIKARDFLQKSYDALELKVGGIQKTSAALQTQRDELKDQNAQLEHNVQRLRFNFSRLGDMIRHITFSQVISSKEKEKLQSSHDVVLEQRDQLNISLRILEDTSSELQDGYTAAMMERGPWQPRPTGNSAVLPGSGDSRAQGPRRPRRQDQDRKRA